MTRKYLLDTGIAQDFIEGRFGVLERVNDYRRKGHKVGICVPVLGELWSGVEGSASRELNLRRLRHALSRLVIWPYGTKAAEEFGRLFTLLKRRGRVIQQIDLQIAAIAFTIPDCVVVIKDADFLNVPFLTIEN